MKSRRYFVAFLACSLLWSDPAAFAGCECNGLDAEQDDLYLFDYSYSYIWGWSFHWKFEFDVLCSTTQNSPACNVDWYTELYRGNPPIAKIAEEPLTTLGPFNCNATTTVVADIHTNNLWSYEKHKLYVFYKCPNSDFFDSQSVEFYTEEA